VGIGVGSEVAVEAGRAVGVVRAAELSPHAEMRKENRTIQDQ